MDARIDYARRISGKLLVIDATSPTRREIRDHMTPNLCRCGTHMRIVRAIERAARMMQASGTSTKETA